MRALTRWRALGTTVEVVVTDPADRLRARAAVERELVAIDRACSRFRTDSDLARLNEAAGRGPVAVGALLREALGVALEAAARTGGAVDPTVGAAMAAAGYDRDLGSVAPDGPAFDPRPAPGVGGVVVDAAAGTVALPAGVALDLGATAKAWAADRAARAALRALRTPPAATPSPAEPRTVLRITPAGVTHGAASPGGGVLVSLGGDVAVAGPAPPGGWAVGIADDHRDRAPEHVVAIERGGLATSGLTARSWRRGGRAVHHVLDPRTGAPVDVVWRTVSVAAPSCAVANAWSTAALVRGGDAPAALGRAGVAARLVAADGEVVLIGGWPADDRAPGRRPGDRPDAGRGPGAGRDTTGRPDRTGHRDPGDRSTADPERRAA